MSLDTTLCYLTARGAQLPVGEESRLESLSISGANERYAVSFNDSGTQQLIWTIPYWPGMYDGVGTLKANIQFIMTSATSGGVVFGVEIEAITPTDTVDLDSAVSFDTVNTATGTALGTAGYLATVSVTLTNKDSVAVGDYVRIRLTRIGANGSDTASGNCRVLGATIVEQLTTLNLGGATTVKVNKLAVVSSATSFPVNLISSEALTASRDLSINVGDANRTLTLNAFGEAFLAAASVSAERGALSLATTDAVVFASIANTVSSTGVARNSFTNTNSGVNAHTAIDVGNNTGTSAFEILLNSSNNTAYAGANGVTFITSGDFAYYIGGTEKMRMTTAGRYGVGVNPSYQLHTVSANNEHNIYANSTHASFSNAVYTAIATRAANSGYYFFQALSGNGGDVEFYLRGDGTGLCDGSWTGGGADYAEYFEWADGNPFNEDRIGLSVSLVGNKIKIATEGDDPIGVVSGNPTVVGDASWSSWSEKYLRDDFNRPILDESGNKVLNPKYKPLKEPKTLKIAHPTKKFDGKPVEVEYPNPHYNPDLDYKPREVRREWDTIGIMGKLRVRVGQIIGSRWIMMRHVTNEVDEYLVR